MPIRPNLAESAAFHLLRIAPLPLLDVFGAFSFRVLVAGLRLGVFEACAEPTRSSDLAADLDIREDSLGALLRALEAIGYVKEEAGGWVNTAATDKWLAADDGSGVRSGVEYWARLLDGPLMRLDERLTSAGGETLYEWLDAEPETADLFQAWMIEIAGLVGSEIVRSISPDGLGSTLLDVGGGHGWYAIQLCLESRELTATILDHPSATRTTPQRIEDAGLGDRISIVHGDYLTYRAPEPFDTVLMFNILHGHKGAGLERLLARSREWVSADGQLLVVEQVPTSTRGARATSAMLALAYDQLLHGAGHDYEALRESLTAAGYGSVGRKRLLRAPGTALITARP